MRIDPREAREHQDRPGRQAHWQRLERAQLQSAGCLQTGLRRYEAQPVASGHLASGVAERVRRPGNVQQHHVRQQREDDLGRELTGARARDPHASAPEVATTRAKRPSSTSSVCSRISCADTSRPARVCIGKVSVASLTRSEEHTSELQSHLNLVCRLLLEKKKTPIADQSWQKQTTAMLK